MCPDTMRMLAWFKLQKGSNLKVGTYALSQIYKKNIEKRTIENRLRSLVILVLSLLPFMKQANHSKQQEELKVQTLIITMKGSQVDHGEMCLKKGYRQYSQYFYSQYKFAIKSGIYPC